MHCGRLALKGKANKWKPSPSHVLHTCYMALWTQELAVIGRALTLAPEGLLMPCSCFSYTMTGLEPLKGTDHKGDMELEAQAACRGRNDFQTY